MQVERGIRAVPVFATLRDGEQRKTSLRAFQAEAIFDG